MISSSSLIVLLAHNRPKILKRCISTATKHSKTASNACWIVMDDSVTENALENLDILKEFASSGLDVIHITNSKQLEIFQIISKYTLNQDYEIIFEKSCHRDISGLRNLGLFLNFIFKSDLTFLWMMIWLVVLILVIGGNAPDRSIIGNGVRRFGRMVHAQRDRSGGWDSTEEPSPVIRDGALIGANAIIIGGIEIGKDSVIAANEVVKANVPEKSIFSHGKIKPLR